MALHVIQECCRCGSTSGLESLHLLRSGVCGCTSKSAVVRSLSGGQTGEGTLFLPLKVCTTAAARRTALASGSESIDGVKCSTLSLCLLRGNRLCAYMFCTADICTTFWAVCGVPMEFWHFYFPVMLSLPSLCVRRLLYAAAVDFSVAAGWWPEEEGLEG